MKKDAPAEILHVKNGPEMPLQQWQRAEVGMYLLEDVFGQTHAVRPEQLTGASLNKLKSARFQCLEPTANSPVIREIHPKTIDPDKPAITAN